MTQNGILAGLRLVEAAAFVAAPLGGMTLAQMGAEVIRIDTIGGGLDYRRWPVTENGVSLFWCGLNKSKKSVALDLSSGEGREIATAIITAPGEDAGLFLTNFPPRGWLDYEQLKARRADLIQLTLQGDRHGGSAVDYTVNPRLGLPCVTGPREDASPTNHVLPAWDLITGQMVAVGLLAAERHRRRTHEGQHVKIALQDVGLAVMSHLGFIVEAELGQARQRHGNDLYGAFGRDFLCADGERVMVVGLTGKQWRALCNAMQMQGDMQALATRLGLDLDLEGNRFMARQPIAECVEAWVGARPYSVVAEVFDRHGVCWSRYQTLEQLVREDPECSLANPLFARVVQPGVGNILSAGLPLRFATAMDAPPRAAPQLGAHTEQVLSELLGIDAVQYGRLHDKGVVAGPSQAS